jgi:hypothetical protein
MIAELEFTLNSRLDFKHVRQELKTRAEQLPDVRLPVLSLAGWLDAVARLDLTVDFPELCLILTDAVPDQHEDVAVQRPAFILRDKAQLVQHFLLDADGYALHRHSFTS